MIYRQKSKKGSFALKLVIVCLAVFGLLRLMGVNLTDGVLKNAFNYVIESKVAALAPVRGTLVYFQSKSKLERELKERTDELLDAKIDLLTQDAVDQEFESFKSQFGQPAEGTQPIKVILRPPFLPFDIIRLSGNLERYIAGNPVYYKNVVIGTLVEKTGRYGSVELFSTPGKVVPASIRGTQFEAKGLGGGRYMLEASKEFEIAEGDPILYPSEQVILLGVVEQVESNEEDLFKKVYFNLPVPLDSIAYVSVGLQAIQPPPVPEEPADEDATDETNDEQDEQSSSTQ